MKWKRHLRLAQALSRYHEPDKQHIVVVAGFSGRQLKGWRVNTIASHAERRLLADFSGVDRLVVYRFNRADPTRAPRPSCPCSRCVPKIRESAVRKVEYFGPLGPVVAKVRDLVPYNGGG